MTLQTENSVNIFLKLNAEKTEKIFLNDCTNKHLHVLRFKCLRDTMIFI